MSEVGLAWLTRIGDLLAGKAIHPQRLVHDVRAVPHLTLHIETVGGIREVERAEAHDGVYFGLYTRCFDIEDNHRMQYMVFSILYLVLQTRSYYIPNTIYEILLR